MIIMVAFEYFHTGRDNAVAFLDTVTDTFISINDDFIWNTQLDLDESINAGPDTFDLEFIERLKCLCPIWFLDNHDKE